MVRPCAGAKEEIMEVRELAEAFTRAFNSGDIDTLASFLSDDFRFSGPVPEPIGKDQWVGLSRILKAAFPDIKYNIRITGIEGNVVKTANQVTGTHTNGLDMSFMGMPVIPATGKAFSNPEETAETTVEGDKVTAMHVTIAEGGGLMGILAQIGVKPPQA